MPRAKKHQCAKLALYAVVSAKCAKSDKVDNLCLVIDDVVKVLNLSYVNRKVHYEGNPAYHPAMMLKILFLFLRHRHF